MNQHEPKPPPSTSLKHDQPRRSVSRTSVEAITEDTLDDSFEKYMELAGKAKEHLDEMTRFLSHTRTSQLNMTENMSIIGTQVSQSQQRIDSLRQAVNKQRTEGQEVLQDARRDFQAQKFQLQKDITQMESKAAAKQVECNELEAQNVLLQAQVDHFQSDKLKYKTKTSEFLTEISTQMNPQLKLQLQTMSDLITCLNEWGQSSRMDLPVLENNLRKIESELKQVISSFELMQNTKNLTSLDMIIEISEELKRCRSKIRTLATEKVALQKQKAPEQVLALLEKSIENPSESLEHLKQIKQLLSNG